MQKIRKDFTLGSNIRKYRIENHFTQSQVIAQLQSNYHCDISRETYAKIESGLANIRANELVAFSQLFQVDISRFFDGISIKY